MRRHPSEPAIIHGRADYPMLLSADLPEDEFENALRWINDTCSP